ncbi:MAG: hypothetical protein ACXWTN_10320 [Methylosarcina sp.]
MIKKITHKIANPMIDKRKTVGPIKINASGINQTKIASASTNSRITAGKPCIMIPRTNGTTGVRMVNNVPFTIRTTEKLSLALPKIKQISDWDRIKFSVPNTSSDAVIQPENKARPSYKSHTA